MADLVIPAIPLLERAFHAGDALDKLKEARDFASQLLSDPDVQVGDPVSIVRRQRWENLLNLNTRDLRNAIEKTDSSCRNTIWTTSRRGTEGGWLLTMTFQT
jgi:hypothetical protein